MSNAKKTLEWMAAWKADLSRPQVQKMIGGFLHSHLQALQGRPAASLPEQIGSLYAQDLIRHSAVAEAYFLDQEMMPVVTWGARSLDEQATFEVDLWPTPYGFVLLDDPMFQKDIRGRLVATKALFWYPLTQTDPTTNRHGPGTVVIHLTDVTDERDETTLHLLESGQFTRNDLLNLGRLQVSHIDYIPHGHQVGPQVVDTSRVKPDRYGLPSTGEADNQQRFILSFLLMLNQTITRTERVEVSKKHAARMTKRRLPSTVTVVKMRRLAGASRAEGESQVEWAHRWIVRGHWRNQPCKMDDQWTHRRIWIAPFVKGPEDKPLLISEKVYSLER